jgi:CheY-like chemotaxis protein
MNKILLVEDNPGDAELTRLAFEAAGIICDLQVAETGEKALDYLETPGSSAPQSSAPQLILLDLNLPGMGGHDVLRRIKSNDALKRIPVVVLSSSASDEDIGLSYDLAANSYVQKPIDMTGFVRVVEAIGAFWFSTAKLPAQSRLTQAS